MSPTTFDIDPPANPPRGGMQLSTPAPGAGNAWDRIGLLGWTRLPWLHYALGLIATLAVLLLRFHPTYGSLDHSPVLMTAIQHFQDAQGNLVWRWALPNRLILVLCVLALGYLGALIAKPGRKRGLLVLVLTLVAFVSTRPPPQRLFESLAFAAAALVAGALWIRREDRSTWGQRAFWIGMALLAAALFLPQTNSAGSAAYTSGATSAINALINPPSVELEGSIFERGFWVNVFGAWRVLLAMGIFALGLLHVLGVQARWLANTSALFLLAMVIGFVTFYALDAHETQVSRQDLGGMGNLLHELGNILRWSFCTFALPFAAAVSEAGRRRTA